MPPDAIGEGGLPSLETYYPVERMLGDARGKLMRLGKGELMIKDGTEAVLIGAEPSVNPQPTAQQQNPGGAARMPGHGQQQRQPIVAKPFNLDLDDDSDEDMEEVQ